MTKYACTLAGLLALTGCEHSGGGGYGQSGTATDTGAYGGTPQSTDRANNVWTPVLTSGATSGTASQPSTGTYGQPAPDSTQGISTQPNGTLNTTSVGAGAGSTSGAAQSTTDQRGQDLTGNQGNLSQSPNQGSTQNSTTTPTPGAFDQSGQGNTSGVQAGTGSGIGAQSNVSGDRALSQSVTNALTAAGISSETLGNIRIRAINGRVILVGQVPAQADKDKIESQIKEIPGVQAVSNLLQVKNGVSSGSTTQPESSTTPGTDSSSPSSTTTPVPK